MAKSNQTPCVNCGAPAWGVLCSDCRKEKRTLERDSTESGDFVQSGDSAKFNFMSDREMGEAEALKHVGLDSDIWEVKELRRGYYHGDPSNPDSVKYQHRVTARRRVAQEVETALATLLERTSKQSLKVKKLRPRKSADLMLEFSPADHHFGKYCWDAETGENYDLDIARAAMADAVEQMLEHVAEKQLARIVMPVGNDLCHYDSWKPVTPNSGNIMDTDSRYAKMVEVASESLFHAIGRLSQAAPVHAVWVPGNHSPGTSFHIARWLGAMFHQNPNVTVDVAPNPRKYLQWGEVLLGWTHGDQEPHAKLPTIMAMEQREAWAQTSWREWHIGHFHKRKAQVTTPVDEFEGVVVRTLPSMSGRDAWHHAKGYIGGPKSAEGYLWSRSRGYVATLNATIDPKLYGKTA